MIQRDNAGHLKVETNPNYPARLYRNGWSTDMSGETDDTEVFGAVDIYSDLDGKLAICANSRFQEREPCWILPNGAVITKDRPKWIEIQQILAIAVTKRITVGDEILQNPVVRWNVVYDRRLSKCRVKARTFSGCHAVL